jgi:hypothetical protein
MLLNFELAVFCLFEARDPEFDIQPLLPPHPVQYELYTNTVSNSGTLASNWQNTSEPEVTDVFMELTTGF